MTTNRKGYDTSTARETYRRVGLEENTMLLEAHADLEEDAGGYVR